MRLLRSFATLLLAVGVATCSDTPNAVVKTAPDGAARPGKGRFAISPRFTPQAAAVYAQRATFAAVNFDRVRILLTRPPNEVVIDTVVTFNQNSPTLTLDLFVDVRTSGEVFDGTVQYTNNGAVVYEAKGKVQSYPPDQLAPTPQEMAVVYVGPGANATRLTVSPATSSVVSPGVAQFTAAAFDAQNQAVTNVPIAWSISDATVATVSTTSGPSTTVTPTGKRGTVTVTATGPSPTLTGSGSLTVSLPPANIVLVSGGGQSGKAGAALAAPAVVRVVASDGIGVAGVSVQFAAPTGGGVGTASATTDAQGQASSSMTLGGALGAQSFAASAGGFSVSIPATATPGDPATIAVVSGQGQIDTVSRALRAPFVVQVSDRFGNGVPSVTVTWAKTSGGGALSGATSVTGADGTASMGYTLGPTAGPETVTASAAGVATPVTFTATAVTGPAGIAIVSGNAQTGRVSQPLAAPLVVRVTDVANAPVSGAVVTWTATNGTVTGGGATDAQGQTSASFTLGTTVGGASATATVGTGANAKSVTFSATVQPGTVARIVFKVGPSNAAAGAAIAPSIEVELQDAGGNRTNAVNSVSIALGANPGQATLGGTLTRNAVAGVATFDDITVSAAANGYTLVASSAGVPNITSAAFNITGTAPTNTRTWTGAVSADWSNAGNWSGGGVPTATNDVVIPGGTQNQPTLTAASVARSVVVANAASLSLGNFVLTVNQSVDGGTGTGITGAGFVLLTGTFRGNISNILINGAVSAAGPANISGTLGASSGTLTLAQIVTVGTQLVVNSSQMQTPAQLIIAPGAQVTTSVLTVLGAGAGFGQTGGAITVTGGATFNGNTFAGLNINAGTLTVGGDFTQTAASTGASFVATGTHRVVLNGSSPQTISFADPAASRFQNLELAGSGAKTISTPGGALTVSGQLMSPSGPTILQSSGRTIAAGGVDIDGLTVDNTLLTITNGTITRFDAVTFQGYAATATPLTITHPGAATPFTFNNTQFLVTPTSGRYLGVTDGNPSNGLVLTIDLVNSTPANGSAQTATSGGAQVNWLATGAAIAWTNPAGGNWSTPSNWSLGRVPSAADSVVIALAGTYTINLDTTFTGTYITLGAASGVQTLSLQARTLTLANVLTVLANGVLSLNSGTVAGGATIVNQGIVGLLYGTIAVPLDNRALLFVNGGSNVSGPITTTTTSLIRLRGDGSTGFANLTVANGFTNNGGIDFSSTGSTYSTNLTVTNGTLLNSSTGSITSSVGTGGARTMTLELNNQGNVTALHPMTLTRSSPSHTNSGTIDASLADLTIAMSGVGASFTNTGSMTIGTGRTLAVTSGTFNQNGGSIVGPGTLQLSSSTANFATNVSTATLGLALSSSTIAGSGTVTNAAGQTITLYYSTINAPFVNQGTIVGNGSSGLGGTVTTAAGSIIRLQPDGTTGFSNFTIANGFTNNGAIELTSVGSTYSASLFVTAGTLVNAPGATLSSLVGTGGARSLAAELDNQGTFTIAQPISLNRGSSANTNSGTIDLTTGDLTVSQSGTVPSFTNSGTINIAAGRTLAVQGGTFTQSAGTIGGAGTLSLLNTTASFATSFSNALTALTVSSSTLNGPGTITNAAGRTLTLFYGTVNAPLVNHGTIVTNGTSAINGSYTSNSASILRLLPDGTTGFSNTTFANGFVNSGTIELTATGSTYSATLFVTAGTLTNASGGSIVSVIGSGGPRTITAEIDNQGTITVLQPLALNRGNSTHVNSGTIDVSADFVLTQSGTSPSFSNSGTVNIAATRSWSITGGTLNQNGSVTGAGTWALSSVTANVQSSFSNATTALTLLSSTVNGPGTFTNASGRTLTMHSSTFGATAPVVNQGTIVTNGASTINGSFTTAAGSILRLQPDGTTGFSNTTFANGFTNDGSIELTATVSTYSTALIVTNGTLVNSSGGTITSAVGTGGPRTITAQLDNQGLVNVLQPLTFNRGSSALTNSGTINASANVTVTQSGTTPSFSNSGTVTVAAGQSFAITGGTFNQSAGTFGGAGTLSLTSATANFATNFTNATTTLLLNSTTVNGPGTITNAAGRTLVLNSSAIGANAPFTNDGTLISNGTSAINGAFTAPAGSTVRLQPDGTTGFSNLTFANGFTNNGTIELTSLVSSYSATLTVTNGTLANASGGTIASLVGTGGPRTFSAELNNQGQVTLDHPMTINRASAQHTNTGTITLANADLTVSQSGTAPTFTNASGGTISVGAGRTFTITAGTFTQATGATLSGGGTFSGTNVVANFNTAFTLGGLTLVNSTANVTNALSTGSLAINLDGATINGTNAITNAAGQTFSVRGTTLNTPLDNLGTIVANGTTNFTGTFTNAAGAILRLRPDGSTGFSNLTINNGFTNNGAIELTSVTSTYSATLTVPNGTLVNASGATIHSVAGTGGTRTLSAQLDNQGLVTIDQSFILAHGSAAHTNSGTINVTAGDFAVNQSGTTPTFSNATGTITVSPGRTWTVNSGSWSLGGSGTLNGGGALTLNNVGAVFGTTFTLSALSLNSATTTFLSSFSTAGLAINVIGGTVGGPATITNAAGQTFSVRSAGISTAVNNQGVFVANGGSSVSGGFANLAGATLRVQADGTTGFATLAAPSGLNNSGTIELNATVSGYPAEINATGGVLSNGTGGVITSFVGTGGTRTLRGSVHNQGTINIGSGGTGILVVNGAFTNASGTVNIKLNGTAPGTGYDQLQVTGTPATTTFGPPTPSGTLNVSLVSGFTPAALTPFDVLTASGGITGTFATYNLPTGSWTNTQTANAVTVRSP